MRDHTKNPVIVFNDAGRILDANAAAARLIGRPLLELRGMYVLDPYHCNGLQEGVAEEVKVWRRLRCCDGRSVRIDPTATRRTQRGYRIEFRVPSQPVELPTKAC